MRHVWIGSLIKFYTADPGNDTVLDNYAEKARTCQKCVFLAFEVRGFLKN